MHDRHDKHNHHHHHDEHHHYILWSYPNRHHNQHHHHQQTLSGAFVTIAIAIIINVTYYRVTSIHSFFDGSANKMKPLWMTCNHCFDAVHYIFQCQFAFREEIAQLKLKLRKLRCLHAECVFRWHPFFLFMIAYVTRRIKLGNLNWLSRLSNISQILESLN